MVHASEPRCEKKPFRKRSKPCMYVGRMEQNSVHVQVSKEVVMALYTKTDVVQKEETLSCRAQVR